MTGPYGEPPAPPAPAGGSSTRSATFRRLVGRGARRAQGRLEYTLGGATRTRVIVLLACVLGLSSADTATVGASAIELRSGLGISNTDIGLLVAVSSLVAAVASVPFGILADRVRRVLVLGIAISFWGAAMIWSATVSSFGELLLTRLVLGVLTAAAGPIVASLVGDYFHSAERGRIYGYVLAGELLGAGLGFAVTGDIAALSWRAAFAVLGIPAFILAWYVFRLPEPARGATAPLEPAPGSAVIAAIEPAKVEPGQPVPDEPEVEETDAQRLVREQGVLPDEDRVLRTDGKRLGIIEATKFVFRIRTNVILIVASACGYYFLAGVQTFGVEFVRDQYSVGQVLANFLMLLIGAGALVGVLLSGRISDGLLRRRYVNGRILVPALAAAITTIMFIPALLTRSVLMALPYIVIAAFMLSAQNPPIDAARLDIVPSSLWGRAEGLRTLLRTGAQALAPLLFGAVSQYVFGGGRSGLQWTFIVMLLPLAANAVILFRALRTYPRDIATAAAARPPGGDTAVTR
ncbi:MAG TPA: MFS transporter [Acidimicrobiales bacterium]|nr:MFS transporter [Acidimicrobiales bacterium]